MEATVDLTELQARIDALDYPPTMTYRLSDLAATGMLAERARIIASLAPEFFWPGKRLLDVGANKGYFALRGVQAGMTVTAIDPDKRFAQLLSDLLPHPWNAGLSGFRDFQPLRRFDRVLIGNAWHYLYKEADGWDWVAKLAAICEDYAQVVIEGPTGMECEDMRRVLPHGDDLSFRFAWPKFLAQAWRWFNVSERTPACKYTPDRYVFVLRRKPREHQPAAVMPMDRPLRVFDPPRADKLDVWGGGGLVVKVGHRAIPVEDQIAIEISSAAPHSTPLLGWLFDRGDVVGWFEPWLHGESLLFKAEEAEVLAHYVDRQRFLLHCGLFDEDPGQLNWTRVPVHGATPKSKLVHFDKNSALPLSRVSTAEAIGRARRCWQQSYREPWQPFAERILQAQATGTIMALTEAVEAIGKEVGHGPA